MMSRWVSYRSIQLKWRERVRAGVKKSQKGAGLLYTRLVATSLYAISRRCVSFCGASASAVVVAASSDVLLLLLLLLLVMMLLLLAAGIAEIPESFVYHLLYALRGRKQGALRGHLLVRGV